MLDIPSTAGQADLARGRPALQSSISAWSAGNNTAEDASFVVDGVIDKPDRDYSNHTDAENSPWWQVDLGEPVVIERVRIFNRRSSSDRFNNFSILGSLDGETWLLLYRRVAGYPLGHDDEGMLIEVDMQSSRFLRIRSDDHGVLHLRSVQVFGHVADRTDTEATQRVVAKRVAERLGFVGERQGEIGIVGGCEIFADHERYGAPILASLRLGDYEGKERAILSSVLRPDDRVIEVGTAIGVISMTAATVVGARNVVTYEANPYIVEDARRNFAYNDLNGITAINAVLSPAALWREGETIPFALSNEFWASRLGATLSDPDIVEVVEIPTLSLEKAIADHRANFLICDIEGGEIALLEQADLSMIDAILMETHYWSTGRAATSRLFRKLIADGFDLDLDVSSRHVSFFRRNLI